MKRFERISIGVALIIFLLLTNKLSAQVQTGSIDASVDSVEISLLTCDARQNVYSLYGHTAIRVQDKSTLHPLDVAVNYGMFSFSKPFFVLRFVFGLTDYEMGIEPFSDFFQQYSAYGCGVRQQVLNLTDGEKAAMLKAIGVNYEPQNRVYRYNYFYDNCTTRARDMIVGHISGTVRYPSHKNVRTSYREMIHAWNDQHPWARFGNDLLLGIKSDFPTNAEQQQFLPDNLRADFDGAAIVAKDGSKRPLVAASYWIVPHVEHPLEVEFPLTPTQCALILAALIVVLTLLEWRKRCTWWGIDAVLLLADGLCGLILLAMVFSEHPTVSLNFQMLALNPLSIVFLYPAVNHLRRGRLHWWLPAFCILLVLFLFGGIFQQYAEGITIVALSLLFRYSSKTLQLVKGKK